MSARTLHRMFRRVASLLVALPFAAAAAQQAEPSIAIDPTDRPQASLIAALQTELPPGASVTGFDAWRETPVAPAIALLEGVALLDLGAAAPVPVRFHATLDSERQDVIDVSYRLTPGTEPASDDDAVLGTTIASQIDAKLVQEFSDQPVSFSLVEVTAIRHTPRGIIMQGYGTADFEQEGTADVTFIATFDRDSSALHALQYELETPATEADWSATADVTE